MDFQKVDLCMEISGAYTSFEEMRFSIIYDITNDIQLGNYSLKEIAEYEPDGDGYHDIQNVSGYKKDNKYFIDVNSM